MNRVDRGWALYIAGHVTVDFISDDMMSFEVLGSNGRGIHRVDMMDDTWNCSCPDFHNRNDRESTKQLICKHIHASMFKVAEINGFKLLKKLQDMLKEQTERRRYECQI